MRRLLLLSIVPLVACSDPADMPPAEALERVVELSCTQAHDCRDSFPYPPLFESIFGANPEACMVMFRDELRVQATLDAIAAGRIAYDGEDASACLQWAADRTCAELWADEGTTEPASCENAFVGTVGDGGACVVDMECTGDLSCDEEALVCSPAPE